MLNKELTKRIDELEKSVNSLRNCIVGNHVYRQVPGSHSIQCEHCPHRVYVPAPTATQGGA